MPQVNIYFQHISVIIASIFYNKFMALQSIQWSQHNYNDNSLLKHAILNFFFHLNLLHFVASWYTLFSDTFSACWSTRPYSRRKYHIITVCFQSRSQKETEKVWSVSQSKLSVADSEIPRFIKWDDECVYCQRKVIWFTSQ